MRASIAFLSALVAPSTTLSLWGGNGQKAISANSGVKIPGESPLEFCADNNQANDYIEIESVDLSPNPPAAGKDLAIKAYGTVKKTIEQGAYIKLSVKYGLITLLRLTTDLCEQISEVELKCPVEPGDKVINKTVELPKEIPPGTYTVVADVFTASDEQITCLTATVNFGTGGLGNLIGNEL